MPIAEGIAAAKGALDVSKLALDLLRRPKIDGEEVRNRLIEMQDLIFSAQRALGDAEQENRDLRRQLENSKRMADFGKDFTLAEGLYWRDKYPYCPTCWDVDRKPVRLGGPVYDINVGEIWQCPTHKVHHITRDRH
jgi:hypothetical protein